MFAFVCIYLRINRYLQIQKQLYINTHINTQIIKQVNKKRIHVLCPLFNNATDDWHTQKRTLISGKMDSYAGLRENIYLPLLYPHVGSCRNSFSFSEIQSIPIQFTIVIRNGKIVLKHGQNRSFYRLMLRTKRYQNPFFSTVDQNVNKPKSRAVGLFMDLLFYLFVR